jgi:MFS-type transporter involved in bile tolerance (Atg22 family)
MNKKQLFLWSLYDFANSIVFVNFLLYFAQWITIDGGLSDFWYNAIFAIATVLLFISAPTLAGWTDKYGGRKFFLNIATIGTFISYGLAVVFANIYGSGATIYVAMLFLLGQYFYQLAFVFYNPLLLQIADKEHRSRASGIGQFSNALGQVVGLVITLPLASSRLAPLVPAVIIFFILALPMMIYFKDNVIVSQKPSLALLKKETKDFYHHMKRFFALSVATPVLVAFFFFNDALVTMSNNYSIYMQRVFGVEDKMKSILLIAILAMSAIGGMIAGWVGDKFGIRKTLKIILSLWIIVLPLLAIAPTFKLFFIITIFAGLLIGSVWTVTRAYMASVLEKEQLTYGFSFYTIMERCATFVGPLAWGSIILGLGPTSTTYRIAMGSMAVFMIIGLCVISFWKREPNSNI